MTRSNTPLMPAARPGSLPPEQDPNAWAQQVQARPQRAYAGQAPQQAYQGYPQGQPEAPPVDPYAQAAHPYHQGQGQQYAPAPVQGYPQQAPDPYAGAPQHHQPAPQHRPYTPPHAEPQLSALPVSQTHAYGGPAGYGTQGVEPHFSDRHIDQHGSAYDQWPAPAPDYRNFDLSAYGAAGAPAQGYAPQPQHHAQHGASDWGAPDPYAQPVHVLPEQAFAQPHGGALEQGYAEEEEAYEPEEPRRGRSLKIAAVLAGAVIVGSGLVYSYNALLGPSSDGDTPVVKSADGPFKVKPSDPGGKQFAHTDSKIMGRLGEGGAAAGATAAGAPASAADEAAAAGTDPVTGARKVPLLVVGRDGTIQAPAATAVADEPKPTTATVAVPGMTVIDGLGGAPSKASSSPAAPKIVTAAATAQEPVVVNPPAASKKKEKIETAAVTSAAGSAASLSDAPPAKATAAPAKDTVAALAPEEKKPAAKKSTSAGATAATGPQPTGAGYVVVLASVPASSGSRINALQKFADMQQKFGTLLQDKTPDVQEANLGDKGTYHRLLVGPPGSRDSANSLCTQLKAQGYNDCWVTAY